MPTMVLCRVSGPWGDPPHRAAFSMSPGSIENADTTRRQLSNGMPQKFANPAQGLRPYERLSEKFCCICWMPRLNASQG